MGEDKEEELWGKGEEGRVDIGVSGAAVVDSELAASLVLARHAAINLKLGGVSGS